MEMDMQSDFERLLLFEHARKTAEAAYVKNPLDTENLTKWGGALIELSQFQTPKDTRKMLLEAASKLEEALEIDPKRHDTMWCLGNALTTLAFVNPDVDEAKPYFQRAAVYFQQANDEDPTNDLYKKSLDLSLKAPEMHAQIHNTQPGFMGSGPSLSTSKTSTKRKETSDFTYDVLGWMCLAVGVVAWLGFAKNQVPNHPM